MVNSASIDFKTLASLFHLSIKDVSVELGICATVLKKVCRKNNIPRWPYRKIKSLTSTIDSLTESLNSNPENIEEIKEEIEELKQKKQEVIEKPWILAKVEKPLEETIYFSVAKDFFKTERVPKNGESKQKNRTQPDPASLMACFSVDPSVVAPPKNSDYQQTAPVSKSDFVPGQSVYSSTISPPRVETFEIFPVTHSQPQQNSVPPQYNNNNFMYSHDPPYHSVGYHNNCISHSIPQGNICYHDTNVVTETFTPGTPPLNQPVPSPDVYDHDDSSSSSSSDTIMRDRSPSPNNDWSTIPVSPPLTFHDVLTADAPRPNKIGFNVESRPIVSPLPTWSSHPVQRTQPDQHSDYYTGGYQHLSAPGKMKTSRNKLHDADVLSIPDAFTKKPSLNLPALQTVDQQRSNFHFPGLSSFSSTKKKNSNDPALPDWFLKDQETILLPKLPISCP